MQKTIEQIRIEYTNNMKEPQFNHKYRIQSPSYSFNHKNNEQFQKV